MASWVQVYRIARPVNLAQALDALQGRADQLGLESGLQAWERLSRQSGDGDA